VLVRNITGNAIARIMLAVYHKNFRSTGILRVGQAGILPAAAEIR
jgi:hypothetical protein